MNKYISKFSKYDTHFNRRDQWQHIAWQDEEPQTPLVVKWLAGAGFVMCLILLMIL